MQALRITLALVGLWLVAVPLTVQAEDAPATPPKGFQALFNGKDLAGWRGGTTEDPLKRLALAPKERAERDKASIDDINKHWRVENGELINDGNGLYLTTVKDFGDFELRLEYKTVAKADSGIYLRGIPQVQIWDINQPSLASAPDRNPNRGSGGLFNNPPKSPGRDPLVVADKPFGEWNSFLITMIADRVSVNLNGKLVVDNAPLFNYFAKGQPLIPVGPIQLQTHGGEIRWRNILIREIPRPLPESGKLTAGKPSGDGWTSGHVHEWLRRPCHRQPRRKRDRRAHAPPRQWHRRVRRRVRRGHDAPRRRDQLHTKRDHRPIHAVRIRDPPFARRDRLRSHVDVHRRARGRAR